MIGGVPLTADIVFKYVFGSEQSTAVLRSFLSAIQIDAGFPAVESVDIRNPFNLQDTSEDKVSIVDVRARDTTGRVFTVEVQAERRRAIAERSLYYWARSYGPKLAILFGSERWHDGRGRSDTVADSAGRPGDQGRGSAVPAVCGR